MKRIVIWNDRDIKAAIDIIGHIPKTGQWEITIKEHASTRSLEQNAKMWAMLKDISKQVEWYGNKLTDDEWKIIFSAALHKAKIVPDLDGTGFVSIGHSTSKMSIREMSDMIELMTSFGMERGVKFSAGPIYDR